MAQTVIGIFDDASEAQTAVQELMEAGFSRNNIDLSNRTASDSTYSAETTRMDGTDNESHREKKEGGIWNFFANLFDMDDDRDRYSTVAERHSVITVHAQTDDEAERAADILDDAGAIDVDERAEQYRSGTYAGVHNTYADTNVSNMGGAYASGGAFAASTIDETAAADNAGIGAGYTGNSSKTVSSVPADPLSPIYGETPHVVSETDSTNYNSTTDPNWNDQNKSGSDWNNRDKDDNWNQHNSANNWQNQQTGSNADWNKQNTDTNTNWNNQNTDSNWSNRNQSESNVSADFPSNPDGNRTIPADDDRSGTNRRSRIFDRSVDDQYRLREDRNNPWNNPLDRSDANRENLVNANTGYNRTVDPESDVTNRN